MAIRVVQVASPAVGTDWRYTIPGEYTAHLIAATATLVTTANPATGADDGPNNKPITYTEDGFETYGTAGPFVGGTNFAITRAAAGHSTNNEIGTRASSTDWNMATLSIGCWVKLRINSQAVLWQADSVAAGHQGWVFGNLSNFPNSVFLQYLNGAFKQSVATFAAGGWHFIGVTYDGANIIFYIDGVGGAAIPAVATVAAVAEPMKVGSGAFVNGNFGLDGAMCGLFVSANVIAAGRWATYFTDATTVGAAQYKADVLADNPLALWMMAELQTQTSRNATLQITDGTSVVGTYPGGALTGSASAFQWTWGTKGAALAQSPNAQVNLVAIPDLILPSGYTIGSRTLDIVSTDQWGPITLWFDDGTGSGTGTGGESKVPYLDALVVPYGTEF